ncbi:nitroreductase / dihydropteridine reductase [Flavobacterium glycines]|uniref:NAD(P)H nitroreductase n=1 Tax=Flavobacterium glycines TaxID=551990 RepID=A0A1B9DJI9_9FLAO|nr:nitroreductase family protein [Flavobacterium glycines]OCB69843.1 NAD(P)H-dependent oxidoreductase [Flavobacterium glycines]GEL12041.1 NAD(P)H nitroreductase [Flavobacterium glycines]SDJ91076.1 nitroreductase / dihydropteridine reductase [Flavobacterium glycines]
MNILELIQKRYTAKHYQSDKVIPQDKIEELKEILRLTPSSINIQPWKFTFVQNPEMKSKLAAVSMHNTEKINQAHLLVVFSVADDLDAFQKVVDEELPAARRDWYNKIKASTPEAELKTWLAKQVYIALGVGLTASIALGLDSTAMEGIESDKYSAILGMTEYKPLFAMAVGYGSKDDFNRIEITPKSRRSLENVIESI